MLRHVALQLGILRTSGVQGGGGQCEGVRELCTMGRFSHILRRVALQVSHLRTSCRSYYGWEVLRRSAMGSGESRCR